VSRREIVEIGHPVLRERARELSADELASPGVQGLIDDMIETMRAANGAGLAANQVGEAVRVAVVEVRPGNPRYPYKPEVPLTVIVNPVIEPVDEEVRRGLTAGTFQHELDHLDGVLFLDRVTDRATLATWDQFDRFGREEFERRAREIVERTGS
jgi:peptide deformylase